MQLSLITYAEWVVKIQSHFSSGHISSFSFVLFLGLGHFDHFHFTFGFGWFLTKNCSLGFPRFGFSMLTVMFTLSLQQPSVGVTLSDALQWWPAFTSRCVVQNELARNVNIIQATSPAVSMFKHTHSTPSLHVVNYQHMMLQDVKCSYVISYGLSAGMHVVTIN